MAPAGLERWSALVLGATAISWGLTQLIGLFATLALLGGLGAGVVTLLAGVKSTERKMPLLAGGILVLAGHLLFAIAWIARTPINFKGDNSPGVNQDPPALFNTLVEGIGSWLPVVVLVAILVAFWAAWSLRERGLGAMGLGLYVLVLVLGAADVGANSSSIGLLLQTMFALGFILSGAAALLPVLLPALDDPKTGRSPPPRPPRGA